MKHEPDWPRRFTEEAWELATHPDRSRRDPQLAFDTASGHWRYGEIDWEEFRRVLAGEGPCNRQRMKAHTEAQASGAWVREAALAYARKRAARAAHRGAALSAA